MRPASCSTCGPEPLRLLRAPLTRARDAVAVAGRVLLVVLVVLAAASAAQASPRLRLGFTDTGAALYGDGSVYPTLRELHASVLRVHLNWGGRAGVARRGRRGPSAPDGAADDAPAAG